MQKRPNHKIIFIALLGALLFILVACGEKGNTEDDMQRAQAYLQDYFTVKMEEGAVAARRFMYFEDDSEAEAYVRAANSTKAYRILSSEKVSSALYAFYIEFDTIDLFGEDKIENGYNFVAIMDGEYRVMNNIRHVPDELFDGDRSKYSNDTENTIQPGEVTNFTGALLP